MRPIFPRLAAVLFATLVPLAGLQAQSNYATPYTVTTFAGTAGSSGSTDGTGSAARFTEPYGVVVDGAGTVYVADTFNSTIRKITSGGVVTILAGHVGSTGPTDGIGTAARFNTPTGVAVDGAGNVYVADSQNNKIRAITPGGVVTTFAGSGAIGTTDGTGIAAQFNVPTGIAVDGAGNLYVTDSGSSTIRMITPGAVVTTLAGTANSAGSHDGTGTAATFSNPNGVAVDGAGTLYVADSGNNAIRKITSGAVVTTLAGTAASSGSTDGTGSAARFIHPTAVAVDGAGNLYVTDYLNYTIRKITPAGLVTTLAGLAGSSGSADGTGRAAGFNLANGVAVDGAGTIYVADTFNQTIRKGVGLAHGDFNADAKADILWQNTGTGERCFWLMNGMAFGSWVDLGIVSTDWRIAGTGDFNADGQTDILWENTVTGDRGFYLMNGTTFSSWVDLGVVSTDWRIATVGDFNADGKPDIVWENTVTGDRGIFLMNGTTFVSWVDLGVITTALRIVGTGDFNGDGKTDIIWENTSTGKRVIWLMNGTTFTSSVNLGIVSTDWHIAAVADYNGDGKADFLWENTVSGDRGFWLMNGTTFVTFVDLGIVTTDWSIAN